jgi:hypothetical protein
MTRTKVRVMVMGLAIFLAGGRSAPAAAQAAPAGGRPQAFDRQLRQRLERALDRWNRWLSGYLYQVPGTDLYTLNPTLGGGANPYRAVAGNPFAAAASAYWMRRAAPDEQTARPLRGLMKLVLGTHVAINTIDRPDVDKWGAGFPGGDSGHAAVFAAALGMLAPDALPAAEREQLRKIVAWEGDKQTDAALAMLRDKQTPYDPNRTTPNRSFSEYSAWRGAMVQLARLAFPDAPQQERWREGAIAFSTNALSLPGDLTSDQLLAGRPLRQWVRHANYELGAVQEHHGFYHPGYMGWPLAHQAYCQLIDNALPASRRNPDVYMHNWRLVFDRLKQAAFDNGRFIYCAGYDWIAYGYGNDFILPIAVFAAARLADADAARMADGWLKLVEMQQDLSGGSVQGARLATLQRLRINDFSWYEAISGCTLAQALWVLDHMDTSRMPEPSTADEFHARNVGTFHEPMARLVWHRDQHQWASFSWRACFDRCQGVIQPVRLPNLLKFNYNGTGILDVAGMTPDISIDWFQTDTLQGGGFWTLGALSRLSKSSMRGNPRSPSGARMFPQVREHLAMVALPGGPAVFIDQCQALDQLWLLRSGGLGMRLAADVFTDNQVKLSAGGEEKTFGQAPCRDTWHDLGARSVTIEKVLTIHALAGEGAFQLLQKRQRPPERDQMLYENDTYGPNESLLAHELYFGPPPYARAHVVGPGERFRSLVLTFYCDPLRTPKAPAGSVTGQFPCLTIHLPDVKRTIAVNFSDGEQTTDSPAGRITVGPRSVRVAAQ